jgi:uncharacterized membrane protein YbhN (UPF0104 family)
MKNAAGRALALLVSGALLVVLYRTLDMRLVGQALLRVDPAWLVLSVGMIVPITFLRAVRFFWVAPPGALPGVGEAFRLTLVASGLNVFMPAKTGDLVKSYFVATRSRTPAGVSIAIVVYERFCDLFGLIAWCLAGWALGRPDVQGLPPVFWLILGAIGGVSGLLIVSERVAAAARSLVAAALPGRRLRKLRGLLEGWPLLLQRLRGRRRWVIPFSVLLWLAHLVQIWMFTIALALDIPFTVTASLAAIAPMAGQLPFTVGGIGTRDVALVVLLSRYMRPESAAALGVLVSTRNLLPPLLGVPIMRPYLTSVVAEARRWRSAEQAG